MEKNEGKSRMKKMNKAEKRRILKEIEKPNPNRGNMKKFVGTKTRKGEVEKAKKDKKKTKNNEKTEKRETGNKRPYSDVSGTALASGAFLKPKNESMDVMNLSQVSVCSESISMISEAVKSSKVLYLRQTKNAYNSDAEIINILNESCISIVDWEVETSEDKENAELRQIPRKTDGEDEEKVVETSGERKQKGMIYDPSIDQIIEKYLQLRKTDGEDEEKRPDKSNAVIVENARVQSKDDEVVDSTCSDYEDAPQSESIYERVETRGKMTAVKMDTLQLLKYADTSELTDEDEKIEEYSSESPEKSSASRRVVIAESCHEENAAICSSGTVGETPTVARNVSTTAPSFVANRVESVPSCIAAPSTARTENVAASNRRPNVRPPPPSRYRQEKIRILAEFYDEAAEILRNYVVYYQAYKKGFKHFKRVVTKFRVTSIIVDKEYESISGRLVEKGKSASWKLLTAILKLPKGFIDFDVGRFTKVIFERLASIESSGDTKYMVKYLIELFNYHELEYLKNDNSRKFRERIMTFFEVLEKINK